MINVPFSFEDLCDTIHYVEWKVQEVDEAGCDLEHPNIREVLKKLKYTQSQMLDNRFKHNSTDKVQEDDDEDYNPEFDAASYT
jgi:hypothetical protein